MIDKALLELFNSIRFDIIDGKHIAKCTHDEAVEQMKDIIKLALKNYE
jgi:hypothetical protein